MRLTSSPTCLLSLAFCLLFGLSTPHSLSAQAEFEACTESTRTANIERKLSACTYILNSRVLERRDAKDLLALVFANRGVAYLAKAERTGSSEYYRLSIADSTNALKHDRGHVEALHNRGSAYSNSGQYEEAVEDLRAYLRIVPQDPTGWVSLGITYFKKGEYEAAKASFEKALIRDRTSVEALFGLGNSLAFLKKYREAIDAYSRLLAVDSRHSGARQNLGLACGKILLRKPEACP